jgi:hypothetical protein
MSIIEQIWDGRYYPSETIKPTSELYHQRKADYFAVAEELDAQLTGQQKELLTKFLDVQAGTEDLINYEFFYQGMVTGVQLYRELLGLDVHPDISDPKHTG